jgi:hypothetical protein
MPVFSLNKSSLKDTGKISAVHRTWLWQAGLFLLVTIGTWVLPLASELHYEFAAVIAVTASLVVGLGVLGPSAPHPFIAATDHPDATSGERARRELWGMIASALLVSLLPLIVDLVRAPLVGDCGALEGVAWYLMLVPVSALTSLMLALLCRVATQRRWLRILLFFLLWSGSLLRGGYEAYNGPHIFLYAWQIGFFPGGSWDPELPITLRLILYRAAQIALCAGLAVVILELRRTAVEEEPRFSSHTSLALTLLIAAIILVLIPFRSELGLSRTDAWLRAELGDSLHTRFATIYYDAPHTDSLAIWRAANLTDFYIRQHAAALGIPASHIAPVTFYLYPSAEAQKEYVGTSSASFTKPWKRALNIPADRTEGTLEHELAHVMIAPFGNVLGISWSQGLLEGAAVALTRDYGWMTLHEYAYTAYAVLDPPPVDRIMGTGGFTSLGTSLSYMLAGSFSRWLIDTYGMRRYLAVYADGDFDAVYGRSLSRLAGEYRTFLDSQRPAAEWSSTATRYLFGGGSFFLQHCLRRIGSLNRTAFEAYSAERYETALDAFRESLREGANYTARAGMLRTLGALGRYRELLDSATGFLRDTLAFPLIPSLIDVGDARWALGDSAGAERAYRSILSFGIGSTLSTRAALRLYFLRAPDPLRRVMRGYFVRPAGPIMRIETLHEAARLAATAEARSVIELMTATWTYTQYPMTTMRRLAELQNDLRMTAGTADTGITSRLVPFIESSIRRTLSDAALMATIAAHDDSLGIDEMRDVEALVPPDTAYAHAGSSSLRLLLPSRASVDEERIERRAFVEYARRHPILP